MTTQPPAGNGLVIDTRTALESVAAGLIFLLAGIPATGLDTQQTIWASLLVGAIIVVINRLLGKSASQTIEELNTNQKILIAQNSVLLTDAKPSTIDAAIATGDAVRSQQTPVVTETKTG